MYKQSLLTNFIAQYSHLPEQGTDEWKMLRKGFIGGSELSTILKQNKNKSVNKLVLEKLGFDKFTGNVITHWGNVFEEMIRLHCEEVFSCSIRETGSIPYDQGCLSYSPDGVALVPTHRLQHRFGTAFPDGLDSSASAQLVLFEFKCPHSRIPSSEVPEHYWPQVNVGMNIIDIMETAVFVQAVYRRCAFDALKHNKRHSPFGHFKQADTTQPPVECGFMVLYSDKPSEYVDNLLEVFSEVDDIQELYVAGETVFDLGELRDQSLLEEVLGNCVNKTFKVDYCFRHVYDQSVFDPSDGYRREMYDESLQHRAGVELLRQKQIHPNIVGILPYKMLGVYMTPVAKNPKYIEETGAHQKAAKVLQCIEDHRDHKDRADASKSIRSYKL
jgi:hypothetical protein